MIKLEKLIDEYILCYENNAVNADIVFAIYKQMIEGGMVCDDFDRAIYVRDVLQIDYNIDFENKDILRHLVTDLKYISSLDSLSLLSFSKEEILDGIEGELLENDLVSFEDEEELAKELSEKKKKLTDSYLALLGNEEPPYMVSKIVLGFDEKLDTEPPYIVSKVAQQIPFYFETVASLMLFLDGEILNKLLEEGADLTDFFKLTSKEEAREKLQVFCEEGEYIANYVPEQSLAVLPTITWEDERNLHVSKAEIYIVNKITPYTID